MRFKLGTLFSRGPESYCLVPAHSSAYAESCRPCRLNRSRGSANTTGRCSRPEGASCGNGPRPGSTSTLRQSSQSSFQRGRRCSQQLLNGLRSGPPQRQPAEQFALSEGLDHRQVLQAGLGRFNAIRGCLDQGEAHRCGTPGDRPQLRHGLSPGCGPEHKGRADCPAFVGPRRDPEAENTPRASRGSATKPRGKLRLAPMTAAAGPPRRSC
jgi:hypothetical protein